MRKLRFVDVFWNVVAPIPHLRTFGEFPQVVSVESVDGVRFVV